MIKLLDNQKAPYQKYQKYQYIYLKAGVGWGKSFFAMKAIEDNDGNSIIIAPSHLLKQWSKYLADEGIIHTTNSFKNFVRVSVWSVQKLTRMFKSDKVFLKEFKNNTKNSLLVIDEYHRVLGATSNIYRSLQTIPAKSYIFLSATPLERGAQDFYTALRINAVLDIKNNWGLSWRSWTAFKQYHCVMGGFENRIVQSVFKDSKEKMLQEITSAEYEGIEDTLVILKTITVETPMANQLIRDYKRDEEPHFATIRTILNGFRYRYRHQDLLSDVEQSIAPKKRLELHELATVSPEEKYVISLFESPKVYELQKLVKNQSGKALLFYEFTAERAMLGGIESLKFYHKTRYTLKDFENDDNKVMAVHYKSLGEGVRFKFVDTIYLFTISISNRSKTQAIGRAIYAGRSKKIKVYEFTTNTTEEKRIVRKLNQKENNVKNLFNVRKGMN